MPRSTNTLNDLTGKEWIKFTRTWFVCDSPRYWRNKDTELHPARFPEEMVAEFLCASSPSAAGAVLDPFAGSGATLVACAENEPGRRRRRAEPALRRALRSGESRDAAAAPDRAPRRRARGWDRRPSGTSHREQLEAAGIAFRRGLPQFDFVITSPPYWRMLRTSRGGVFSKHKQRAAQGLDTVYSESARRPRQHHGLRRVRRVALAAGLRRAAASASRQASTLSSSCRTSATRRARSGPWPGTWRGASAAHALAVPGRAHLVPEHQAPRHLGLPEGVRAELPSPLLSDLPEA